MEPRLLGLTRKILADICPGTLVSPEDVTQSALMNFWSWVRQRDQDDGLDREALWRLVASFAKRRALKRLRAETAQKRGSGKTLAVSQMTDDAGNELEIDQLPSENDAESELRDLLDSLTGVEAPIVRLALAGYSKREICDELRMPKSKVAFVRRKLIQVEKRWKKENE